MAGRGDDVRHQGYRVKNAAGEDTKETSSFIAMNRGKRSITVDISTADGQALIRELERDGVIPGAFHAPRGMLEFWIDPESPYHKPFFAEDKKFVFFCAGGMRSVLAADIAHPAVHVVAPRQPDGEGAEADALDPAAQADGLRGIFRSRPVRSPGPFLCLIRRLWPTWCSAPT